MKKMMRRLLSQERVTESQCECFKLVSETPNYTCTYRVFLIRMLENLFETGFANTTEHCTFEASCEQDVKHEQVNPNSEISSD